MEEKLNKLIELSEKTHKKVTETEGWFIRVLHVGEKLIVPVMLGVLAYIANTASNNISKSQLELSSSQLILAKAEDDRSDKKLSLAQAEAARSDQKHRDDLKAKYVEIFISEFDLKDPVKLKIALSSLNQVDNALAQKMSLIIEQNKQVPKSVTEKISKIRQTARGTSIARATGQSGRWKSYEVCASIPVGATLDKTTAKSRVISGVGPGSWGHWDGDFRYIGTDKVCRSFRHQIHDQDRLLELTVEYDTVTKS